MFRYSRDRCIRCIRCRYKFTGGGGPGRDQRCDADGDPAAANRDSTDTDPAAGSDALSATWLEILDDHFASDNC